MPKDINPMPPRTFRGGFFVSAKDNRFFDGII